MAKVYKQEEFDWLLKYHPLIYSGEQLILDYPADKDEILSAFQSYPNLLPALNIPGVGTRWKEFLQFAQSRPSVSGEKLEDIVFAFGNHLGRVISYRALALTDDGLAKLKEMDCIFPTARLRVDDSEVMKSLRTNGVTLVTVARLFIGLRLVKLDPSLSLHDDWETAVCIAQGYMTPEKPVYRFEIDQPVIETLGWSVAQVHDRCTSVNVSGVNKERWFEHNGIWFDSDLQRTERYVMHEIPFLSARCRSITPFRTAKEVKEALEPYRLSQLKLYTEWKQAQKQ